MVGKKKEKRKGKIFMLVRVLILKIISRMIVIIKFWEENDFVVFLGI